MAEPRPVQDLAPVANDPRGDHHPGLVVMSCEPGDLLTNGFPVRRVEQLIEAIEDHQGAAVLPKIVVEALLGEPIAFCAAQILQEAEEGVALSLGAQTSVSA